MGEKLGVNPELVNSRIERIKGQYIYRLGYGAVMAEINKSLGDLMVQRIGFVDTVHILGAGLRNKDARYLNYKNTEVPFYFLKRKQHLMDKGQLENFQKKTVEILAPFVVDLNKRRNTRRYDLFFLGIENGIEVPDAYKCFSVIDFPEYILARR